MKTLKNTDIQNKTVLLRADFDVSEGSDLRLKAIVPTVNFLLENNCKIVLIGHKGRPGRKVDDKFSLLPIFEKIKTYFPEKSPEDFKFIKDILDEEAKNAISNMGSGEIAMLENVRFYSGEEENDENFARQLANLGDVFVNDAFGACHRNHASIAGIAKLLPSYAGLRLEQEIDILNKAMENPARPAVAIIGGVKIKTKLPVISKMAEIYDSVLVGGKLAIEFQSVCSKENIICSTDYVSENKLDIGQESIKNFREIILKAKTAVWNGPVGKIEDPNFIHGTKAIADAIIESDVYSIIGGGDTVAALEKLGLLNKFDWISTGGGAMLKFMSGEELAGIKCLNLD